MKTKPKSRGKRTAEAELAQRIERVAELLLNGLTNRQIVGICGSEFKCSESTANRYIADANQKIADEFDFSRKAEVSKAVERLLRMQQECLARQDFKTAASIEGQLTKIYGLERQQVEVTHSVEDPIAKLMREIRDGRTDL
jgi:transposase